MERIRNAFQSCKAYRLHRYVSLYRPPTTTSEKNTLLGAATACPYRWIKRFRLGLSTSSESRLPRGHKKGHLIWLLLNVPLELAHEENRPLSVQYLHIHLLPTQSVEKARVPASLPTALCFPAMVSREQEVFWGFFTHLKGI